MPVKMAILGPNRNAARKVIVSPICVYPPVGDGKIAPTKAVRKAWRALSKAVTDISNEVNIGLPVNGFGTLKTIIKPEIRDIIKPKVNGAKSYCGKP